MHTPTRSSARLRQQQEGPSAGNPIPQPSARSTNNNPCRTKRRKTEHKTEEPSKRPVKRRIRPLEQFYEMPTDVLYEIFSYLGPLDLLTLSWSSKALHSVIMGNSARFIWKNAFARLYAVPPSCPPDLNLAQYTKLLFDRHCMECDSLQGHVIWPYRWRLCLDCLRNKRLSFLNSRYRKYLPRISVPGLRRAHALTRELNEVKAELEFLHPSSHKRKEYVKQRLERVNTLESGEGEFRRWQERQKYNKKIELKEAKTKRQNEIITRLSELGWKGELDQLDPLSRKTLPGMDIGKPLTDKGWKILYPHLVKRLETLKERRLQQERKERIYNRSWILEKKIISWVLKHPQPPDVLPGISDVAFSEPFKSFIFNDSESEPAFIMNEDEFPGVMDRFNEEWNEARIQVLLSLIPKSTNKECEGSSKEEDNVTTPTSLDLATTFFKCSSCSKVLSYFRTLAHPCQRPQVTQSRDTDPEDLQTFLTRSERSSYRPWLFTCQGLIFDHNTSDAARMIVRECGETLDEVTAEKMEGINCRLECRRCSGPDQGRLIMKWRAAISHELSELHNKTSSFVSPPEGRKVAESVEEAKWRFVTDSEDLALVYAQEERLTHRREYFICKVCKGRFESHVGSGLGAMQAHWKQHCSHKFVVAGIDDRFRPYVGFQAVPEEDLLRTLFGVPLDQSTSWIRSSVRIHMHEKVDGGNEKD